MFLTLRGGKSEFLHSVLIWIKSARIELFCGIVGKRMRKNKMNKKEEPKQDAAASSVCHDVPQHSSRKLEA